MKVRLLWMAVALCVVVSTAPAQIPAIDHYFVYLLTQPITLVPTPVVSLGDQWVSGDVDVLTLEKFSNPVDKNGEGILDPFLHYTWYRIQEPNITRLVALDNQFGRQNWTVSNAKFLLTPSSKDTADPPPPANHYKCYEAVGPGVDIDVVLQDQWGLSTVTVLEPQCFCNPVEKVHAGATFPIIDPFAHLACYKIVGGHMGLPAAIRDQFLNVSIAESTPCLLCVPTNKLATVPTEESTWGRIKSLYSN